MTGIAELSNAYVEVPVNLAGTFRLADGETFYKGPHTPAVDAAMQTPAFQRMPGIRAVSDLGGGPATGHAGRPTLRHAARAGLFRHRHGEWR